MPLLVVAVAYRLPYRRGARNPAVRGRPVPGWRQACFLAGLAVILGALSPPMDDLSDSLFSVHMAQHLLLGDVAALLIVPGLTGPIMQPVLPRRGPRHPPALAHPRVAP